ncbi:M48 family metallopeptidase [Verrucomicrobiota bacterium]
MATAATTTMDFFQSQDAAKRQTSVLVFYYILAVILIMLGVYFAFAGIFIGVESKMTGETDFSKLWNLQLFLCVMAGTAAVVFGGSLYKISQLKQGGAAVAQMLGGRPVNTGTRDLNERKILNVVEEMAIASGTPVPPVFILNEEDGINAFAAGYSPGNAVIGVTRGCIEKLSRDELQGVIAHEFSHILNGDMRLNIRLMGVLSGILIIAIIGFQLMRVAAYSGRSRSREKGGGAGALIALGLLLTIIGYIGVFFGKLIKSAVSRQREYLADSSAVQFTRNPLGIGGALKKIGGFVKGSRLQTAQAEEASHFFFSNGLASSFLGLMATHPPLSERIRRIDPSFDGKFSKVKTTAGAAPKQQAAAVSGFAAAPAGTGTYDARPEEVTSRIGMVRQEHLDYAANLLKSLPPAVAEAAREPFGARAVIYCLLLNKESKPRELQLQRLKQHADPAVYKETQRIMTDVEKLGPESRLPVIDLAIASLKNMSQNQYTAFSKNIQHLISADEQVDLFEYTLQRILKRYLEPSYRKIKPSVVQYYSIHPLLPQCGQLLSCLAYWGADKTNEAEKAFKQGITRLEVKDPPAILSSDICGLKILDEALDVLVSAAPALKKRVIEACTACIGADGRVTLEEAELLRAVSDSLDCPMPPFLSG